MHEGARLSAGLAGWRRVRAMTNKKLKLVQIEWRDPASDWPWFYLLKMRGEWLHLQGADYPDGSAKHNGDCFWVHKSDVRVMRSNAKGSGAGTASAGLPG